MKIITGRHAEDLYEAAGTTKAFNFFPEVNFGGNHFPVHSTDLIEKCAAILKGDQIVTVSEIVIHFFCREVRFGRMKASDLEIIYIFPESDRGMTQTIYNCKHAIMIGIDDKGDFLQPWPDALFDEDYHLLFDSPENAEHKAVDAKGKP